MKKNHFKIFFFIVLTILIGFYRETFFIRIAWYEHAHSDSTFAPAPFPLLGFLANLSLSQLFVARYVGTVFFVVLFWFMGLLLVKWFFKTRQNYKIVNWVFFIAFFIAIFIYGIGFLFGGKSFFYDTARWIFNLIESPIIIIILVPLFWANKKSIT